MISEYLDIKSDIKNALAEKRPIVALESTIICHGMPFPQNMETALKVEEIVRSHGAVPATIAILNGKLKVGLSKDEIEYLGKKGNKIVKASRRDLPYLISKKVDGATTVASTMIVAHMAGIKIFATGGIGGVHRGAERSFDISADLQELAKTNVAVVCAGIKSVLDLGLTLEYLETNGVPVIGYQTKELPAFYSQNSGFEVDYRLDSPKEIATFIKTKWQMNLTGGIVVTNPIPIKYELDHYLMTKTINTAILEAEKNKIKGKESTPFLLAKVKELTAGKSLDANIQLVYNNAKLAAEIAMNM